MIPFLNLPFALIAAPLLYLPWGNEDIGYGFGVMFIQSWSGKAVFFVYFSAFWGWVVWYRDRRLVAKLARQRAVGQKSGPDDPDPLHLVIVAVLPFLLLAALLVPGGWVVILVAIGFAAHASYRGMRAFGLPWGGVFFLLCVVYAVTVVTIVTRVTQTLLR